jgi:hypothetical protein
MKKIVFVLFFVNFLMSIFPVHAADSIKTSSQGLVGKYACTFTQDGYTYDPFVCIISKKGEQLELVKISGSQRIKGIIKVKKDGFDFDGIYFCPYGECTKKVATSFKKISKGSYVGTFYFPKNHYEDTIVHLLKLK